MYVSCPKCGQQNYSTATQCAYCGSALGATGGGQGLPQGFAQTNAPGFASGATTGGGRGDPSSGGTSSQPQVGQLIDRKYRVERILGEGGMGVVYVAMDVNADQKVVIKSIRPEFANRGDFRERTLAEGKALAKIDHQNVVRFNSIINSPETNELYIVMQFIDGESLDRTLEKANAAGQKLPIPEVIRIFKMALDGVGAAHKEGLMHRDLKPANILVRAKDGVAKVMDFGIAKAEGQTKGPTQAGGIVGSLWYMAPEQIKGAKDLDKRLDIYAMGIVLYELTTGVVPFDGETEYDIMTKHMSEAVPSVKGLRPDAPDWIDQVIAKATQKDRANRYQSCEEFRAAIDQFDGGIVVPRSMTAYENSIVDTGGGTTGPRAGGTMQMAPPAGVSGPMGASVSSPSFPQAEPAPKKSGNTGLIVGVVAVLVLGGGAGAFFAFGGDDSAKKKDTKQTATDDGSKTEKKDEKAGKTEKTDKGEKKPKKDPLDALVGKWKTESSNRDLVAKREGDEVVFTIVKEADWDGAYSEGESRFKLKKGLEDNTFYVIDLYRPAPGSGHSFTASARASCLSTNETVKEKPLEATLKTPEVLEVNFAMVQVGLIPDPGDPKKVSGCKPPVVTGHQTSTLKKQQ